MNIVLIVPVKHKKMMQFRIAKCVQKKLRMKIVALENCKCI